MLVAYPVKFRLWKPPPLFNQTDSSWDIRERQRFLVRVKLCRFLQHHTNNGPATASI